MSKTLSAVFVFIFLLLFTSTLFAKTSTKEGEGIFYNSDKYNKIVNNKNKITEVILESCPEGGCTKEKVDIEKAVKKIESLKSLEKTNIVVADADSSYTFRFNDGNTVTVRFEGQFLKYKGQNYKIKNGGNFKGL